MASWRLRFHDKWPHLASLYASTHNLDEEGKYPDPIMGQDNVFDPSEPYGAYRYYVQPTARSEFSVEEPTYVNRPVYKDEESRSSDYTSGESLRRGSTCRVLLCVFLVLSFIGVVVAAVTLAVLLSKTPKAGRLSQGPEEIFESMAELQGQTFNESLLDKDSDDFKKLEKELCVALEQIFTEPDSPVQHEFGGCEVIEFIEGSVLARFRIRLRPKSPEGFKAEMRIRQKLEEHFAKKIGEHGPWKSVKFNPNFFRRFLKIELPKVETTPAVISTTTTLKTTTPTTVQETDTTVSSTKRQIVNDTTTAPKTTEKMVTKDTSVKVMESANITGSTTKEIIATTDRTDKLQTTKSSTEVEMTATVVKNQTTFPPDVVSTLSDVKGVSSVTTSTRTELSTLDSVENITSVTEFSLNVTDILINASTDVNHDSTSTLDIFMNETTTNLQEIFDNVTFHDNDTFSTDLIQELTTVKPNVSFDKETTARATDIKTEILSNQSTDRIPLISKGTNVNVTEKTSIPESTTQFSAQDKVTKQMLEVTAERITTASAFTSKDVHISTIKVILAATTESYTSEARRNVGLLTTIPSKTSVTDFVDVITENDTVKIMKKKTENVWETSGTPKPSLKQNFTLDFNDTTEPTTKAVTMFPSIDQETSSFIDATGEMITKQGIDSTDFPPDFMNESTTIDQIINETTSVIDAVTDILPVEQMTSLLPTDGDVTTVDILNITDEQMSLVPDVNQTVTGEGTTTFEIDTTTPVVTVLVDTAAVVGETPQVFKIPGTTQAPETTKEAVAVNVTSPISIMGPTTSIAIPIDEATEGRMTELLNKTSETITIGVFTTASETSQVVLNQTSDLTSTTVVTKETTTMPADTGDPTTTYFTTDKLTTDFSSVDSTITTAIASGSKSENAFTYVTDSTQNVLDNIDTTVASRQSTVLDESTSIPVMNITADGILDISVDNTTKDRITLITDGVTPENVSEINMTMVGLSTKELTTVLPSTDNTTISEIMTDGFVTDSFKDQNMTTSFTTDSLPKDNVTFESFTSIDTKSDQVTSVNVITGEMTTDGVAIDGTSTASGITDILSTENLATETYSTDNVTSVFTIGDVTSDQVSTFNTTAGETISDIPVTEYVSGTTVTNDTLVTEKVTTSTITPDGVTLDTLVTPDTLATNGLTNEDIVTSDSVPTDTFSSVAFTTQPLTVGISNTEIVQNSTDSAERSIATEASMTANRSETTAFTATSDIQTEQPSDNVTVDTMTTLSSNDSLVTDFLNDTYTYETDTTMTLSGDVSVTSPEAVTTSYNATSAVSTDTQIVSDMPIVTDTSIGNITAFETSTKDSTSSAVTHHTSTTTDTSKLTSAVMGTAKLTDETVFTTSSDFIKNNTMPPLSLVSSEQLPVNVTESTVNMTDSTMYVTDGIDVPSNVTESSLDVTGEFGNVSDVIDTATEIPSPLNFTDFSPIATSVLRNATNAIKNTTVIMTSPDITDIGQVENATNAFSDVTSVFVDITTMSSDNVTDIYPDTANFTDFTDGFTQSNVTEASVNISSSVIDTAGNVTSAQDMENKSTYSSIAPNATDSSE